MKCIARPPPGEGVIISDNLSPASQAISYGDTLEIPTPNGVLRMPIVGVVLDYSDQQGTVLLDHSVYLKYWGDDRFNIFRVYVKNKQRGAAGPAGDPEPLRQ